MVDPTVAEFVRNPLSPRHAYIACVVTYHAIDRVTYGKTKDEEQEIKQEWREQCPMFALVEIMALDMKHVKSSRHGTPEVPVRNAIPIGLALLGTMGFNTHTLNDTGQNEAVRNLTFVVQNAVKFLHKKAQENILMSEEPPKPVIIKLHPSPEEYEEAENAFLRAVGQCITQWAFVDRMLFRLFRQGIGAPTHRAAIVYYDQHSINSHFRQVDALLKGLFEDDKHKELRETWKEIHQKITDLLPTRNVIAHQPVRRLGTSDGKKAVYIYGIHMEPYRRFLGKQPKGMKGKDALVTEDLLAHVEAVEALTFELVSFSKKVIHQFTRKAISTDPA